MSELNAKFIKSVEESTGLKYIEFDNKKVYSVLKVQWCTEAQKDLMKFHNVDIYDEVKTFLLKEFYEAMEAIPEVKFTRFSLIPTGNRILGIGLLEE